MPYVRALRDLPHLLSLGDIDGARWLIEPKVLRTSVHIESHRLRHNMYGNECEAG